MKLSIILSTLASARLPSVTSGELQQLVGTAEGKAFADDLKWFALGDTGRREHLAAVVHLLAPCVRNTVEYLGFHFNLVRLIAAAKNDRSIGLETIKIARMNSGNRARAIAYLHGIGLDLAITDTSTKALVEPPYYSFKIFSTNAALCISEARTRSGNLHTIQLEGALHMGSASDLKRYDWQNKITIQLTVQEAYLTLGLFENLVSHVKFDGHGRNHEKSLQIEFQNTHYFVRIIQRSRTPISIPVRAVDGIQIVSLLYKQLLRNEEHLKLDDIRTMVGRMAAMMPKN